MKDVQGENHVPSFNPLGGSPRVKVNVGLEGRCKKTLMRGNLMATMVMSMREEEIWFVTALRM
jgi:hypothetical protein